LFIGKEAEGPYQNKLTLFVPGSHQSISEVTAVLVKHLDIECVYFGAGNERGISTSLLTNLLSLPKYLIVTIECDRTWQVMKIEQNYYEVIKKYFQDLRIVFTVLGETPEAVKRITDIKILGSDRLGWCTIADRYTTFLDDPRYNEDKEVH